ncbi:MAG: class I SAM-dependent methyltransferase [Patescibacteria group bacterium]|mgnify:CR=1 FL=1
MQNHKRAVDPNAYTREYYLTDCTGHDEFKKSYGEKLEPRFRELVKYFKIKPKMRVLDVGCGRGEIVLYAAKEGAEGFGIDYSKDAIYLANSLRKKKSKEIQQKMHFFIMDAKDLKFPNSYFDIIVLTDVVEHLYPEELDIVFKGIKRVLKKEGEVIIHTAPNKLFNDFGYKYYSYPASTLLVSIWNIITKNKYPNIARPTKLRTDSHTIMHINEPTYFFLKSLFKRYDLTGSLKSSNITAKKPSLGIKDTIFNFLVFLHPLSKHFPFNVLFGSDFVAILKNQK